ncbi:MAG: hypothetical protein D6746_14885 [Bacteroidetes bacterium]|nr:MAG: hypothetical protein D6746_14885 [Bacteroidota bacterium]
MDDLAPLFPPAWRRWRTWPLSRDQVMLLLMTTNLFFLGLDTYLAHQESGTIIPREWIPVYYGFAAAAVMAAAGLLAARRRPLATALATVTLLGAIVVGLLGTYFHLHRAALPDAPPGYTLTLDLLIWAPPILGPMAFVVVGLLGLSAAWIEHPTGSGTLVITRRRRWRLPFSKTRAYFFITGMGTLAALISSVLDHARTGFTSPWVWLATALAIFGTVCAVAMGLLRHRTRADLLTYVAAMLLLLGGGVLGAYLHIQANLVGESLFVPERFLRGAPVLAPLLYTNMGLIGLVVLLDPRERRPAQASAGAPA